MTIEGGGDFADGDHDTLFYVTGAKPVANDDSAEVDKNTSLMSAQELRHCGRAR